MQRKNKKQGFLISRLREDADSMGSEPVIAGLAHDTAAALAAAQRENERLRQRIALQEEQVRSLLALQAIISTVSADLCLGSLLRRVAAAALRMTASQASALYLLDATAQTLIAHAVENEQTAADSGAFVTTGVGAGDEALEATDSLPRLPLESGLAGWAATNRTFALVSDVAHDARFGPDLYAADARVLGLAPVGLLAVPLIHDDTLLGVLEVAHGPGAVGLDATSLDLAQALAAAAAAAVTNLRVYQKLWDERERTTATEEDERRRLMRVLREGPMAQLAQLITGLDYAGQLARRDPRQLVGEIQRLREQSRSISAELRGLLLDLRPLMHEHGPEGMLPALAQYVERCQTKTGPQIHLHGEYSEPLPQPAEAVIFMVIQEAVANVLQHAQAHNCWIELRQTPDRLVVAVRDDGSGFDAQQVEAEYESRGGLGLLNMLERAAQVGGKLSVASQLGRGTVVSLEIPRGAQSPGDA
jgi:signal transduction histidine kinase